MSELPDPFPYRDKSTGEPVDREGRPLTLEQRAGVVYAHERRLLTHLNKKYGVIESLRELEGFTIVELSRYKSGVVRYRATKGMTEHRMGFAKDEVFAGAQLP